MKVYVLVADGSVVGVLTSLEEAMDIWHAHSSKQFNQAKVITWEFCYNEHGVLHRATLKAPSGFVEILIVTPGTVLW